MSPRCESSMKGRASPRLAMKSLTASIPATFPSSPTTFRFHPFSLVSLLLQFHHLFAFFFQGLCAIYQVSADKKLKAKAFAALSALESDLSSMSKLQSFSHDVSGLVHKSPLGIVSPRVGGQSLSLTWFISPYDLLSVQSATLASTLDKIAEKGVGLSCTVGIISATNRQLPVESQKLETQQSKLILSVLSRQIPCCP